MERQVVLPERAGIIVRLVWQNYIIFAANWVRPASWKSRSAMKRVRKEKVERILEGWND
jgi:hypothetical protein